MRKSQLHGHGHPANKSVKGTQQVSPGPGLPPIPAHPLHGKGHRYGISAKRLKK